MDLQERIDLFVAMADKVTAEYWQANNFTHSQPSRHRADYISDKWCRVVVLEDRGGKWEDSSVYAFIALQDNVTKVLGAVKAGDVHKAATYKAAAKHARGNVFGDFAGCLTPHGIVYLR